MQVLEVLAEPNLQEVPIYNGPVKLAVIVTFPGTLIKPTGDPEAEYTVGTFTHVITPEVPDEVIVQMISAVANHPFALDGWDAI